MTPLFKRSSSSSGWRFFLFGTLSILLMFLDNRESQITEKIRLFFGVVAAPIQASVDWPFQTIHWIKENLSSRNDLLVENGQLKELLDMQSVHLQQLLALKEENKRLKVLLSSQPHVDGRVLGARILSLDINASGHALLLNKGRSDGVFVGQAVLDAHGFLGQVIRVGWFNSLVLPISDVKSAVPVEIEGTGERAILSGKGSVNSFVLNNIPKTSSIQKGDRVFTSSLGGRFPPGYPVGRVQSVVKKPSEMFAVVTVSPAADFVSVREVFLLWPAPKPQSVIPQAP